jgi:N-acetyl-gamma-glutamylphosphate reductase
MRGRIVFAHIEVQMKEGHSATEIKTLLDSYFTSAFACRVYSDTGLTISGYNNTENLCEIATKLNDAGNYAACEMKIDFATD